MSQDARDRGSHEALGVDDGVEALRRSSEFLGPVEPAEDHEHGHATDHLASIYESREEQFAAAIPFVRQGLERGERCLYVADDNTGEEVLAAMRAYGIDVDAALESGALSIHTKADTYLRTGEFDRDAMLAFWEETLEEARDEDGYAGIRAAAEMTWALAEEGTSTDELVEYEAMLNPLYHDDDYAVLCQYNRDRFPSEVIYDVVRTHPHLVHDGAVYGNVYYTPPEEFFGPERPGREVDRMLGTLRERTEVKTELQERKEYFERVFESSHDAFLVVDPEADEIVDANPAATGILGYSHEELLALGPSDLHPHDLDRFREFVGGVLEEGAGWTDELACRTSTGDLIPAEVSAARIELDDRPLMLAAVRDVSERRERERAQRRLYEIAADTDRSFYEKLQAMFELGCERFDIEFGGMARVDVDTDLFEVEVMSGEHDHLVPGERHPLSETYCQEAANGRRTAAITDPIGDGYEGKLCYEQFGVRTYLGTYLEFDGGDDRTFFFLSNEPRDEPFSEADRTFHHLMGQWVKHELERQQYERELEEMVERLRESNDRLEQFAYAASHDLQEPLRMVSSYLQLLEGRYEDELDEDGREFLGFAVDGADRMKEMIHGLLEYSRVETQGEPFEPIDLEDVLEDVQRDLQFRIRDSDAEIHVGELPRVRGDASQLRQVFQNLLENAIEYSGDEPPRVHVSAEPDGPMVTVSVRDEGIGIDPEDADRIFEVFQRLHSREEHEGTGIGLALCKRIVERHDGEIRVESDPGDGTTFLVTLPGVGAPEPPV